ncbi:MAG TPA: metallophosphoesterase [Allosphingosinicella sp.]|nr:metallophosphoesterase [Allosphingosinicella sp.]
MADTRAAESLARISVRAAVRPDDLQSDIDDVLAFLVESEDQTLALIAYLKDPSNPPPAPGGDIEFGFVLYWIHHPPWEIQLYLDLHPLLLVAYELLASRAPPTRLTRPEYEALEADFAGYGEPGPDGTMYGHKKYQQLDKGWMISALNYALNVMDPDSIHHPLPDNKTAPIPLCRKDHDTGKDPVLGIVGDWGTGYYPDEGGALCPAQRVIEQITGAAQSPPIDYLIHLGDTYYAGTDWRPLPDEEEDNFYDLWPDQGEGRNFTLNSNHEMYGAASGYFLVALREGGTFAAQNGMSYFALTYGPWLVLCLDSAYFSDAYNGRKMYMDGAIGTDALDQQIQWVEQFRDWPGPIMVMTHHGGCDTLTGAVTPLYAQVQAALQRQPTLWYWGHVHNGIVYDKLNDSSPTPVIAARAITTKGRCCGHGAIPFGNAWGLEDGDGSTNPNILYYAHTPDPDLPDTSGPNPCNPRVRNGYALVTLHQDGGFTEAFYETGEAGPVWQRSWTAAELEGE